MAYLRDRVIVLKKEPFREQDRRYVMYGREHGLLVAIARGSSVRTSKQAGHLEPFSESEVMIAKGSAFDKLAVARLIRAPRMPRLASFAVSGGISDLIARLLRPGIADERIFDLLSELLRTAESLPGDPSPDRARLLHAAATLKLLDLLGFAPHIERAPEGTSSVPSIALTVFLRRSSFADILRVTGTTDVFAAAADFVDEALRVTYLESPPHGPKTIHSLLA